ncbi:pseudouridine synthase [Spirochaetia bacterium]|nr:pseudouridine synthase [Spirochaetia bacterium]
MPSYSGVVGMPQNTLTRLDRYISDNIKLLRRSQIKKRGLAAMVNNKKVKLSYLIKTGDTIELTWQDIPEMNLSGENIPLDIVFENDKVIVINKQQGLIVHPGAGSHSGTLVHALLWYAQQKNKTFYVGESPISVDDLSNSNVFNNRPFIVHRLDKDTSGILIAAWDNATLSFLADQFKERKVRKTYTAIVQGVPKENEGIIQHNIVRNPKYRKQFTVSNDTNAGKRAQTQYRVVRNYGSYSLLLLRPKTGRTHQIRVHLQHLGTPILGDSIYGKPDKHFKNATLMLHAKSLSITLSGATKRTRFNSPLPNRFKDILGVLC